MLPCFLPYARRLSEQPGYFAPPGVTSILQAAGTRGSPGMVIISPVRTTVKACAGTQAQLAYLYAKAAGGGAESRGLSDREYCVFGYTYGQEAQPSFSRFSS